jgi:hypothetical protein
MIKKLVLILLLLAPMVIFASSATVIGECFYRIG